MPSGPMWVAPPPRPSRLPIVAVTLLAVIVLAVGGLVGYRVLIAPAAQVVREPVATAGANPFMPSVGTDQVRVRPVADAGGDHSGSTPGLYGGSGDDHVCDRSQLSRFLDTHPDMGAGWAAVLGVRVGDIDSYVASLTPVVLRSDTYLTNHGWHDGEVTAFPSVLQAGTAVLVDPYGSPVVRCFCGNPLTAPSSFHTVDYVGPVWADFSTTDITVITSTTTIINNYNLVDVHRGDGIDRPRGTDGDHDRDTGPAGGSDPSGSPSTDDPGGPPTDTVDPVSGSSTDPSSSTSASADPSTVLTSGTWTASSGCPSSLAGSSLSFSGGSFSGGPGGSYDLSGHSLTLTPASSSDTSSSIPSSSSTASSSTASSSTASSSTASSSSAAPKPLHLTLSTTDSPATASGHGCTLTHSS